MQSEDALDALSLNMEDNPALCKLRRFFARDRKARAGTSGESGNRPQQPLSALAVERSGVPWHQFQHAKAWNRTETPVASQVLSLFHSIPLKECLRHHCSARREFGMVQIGCVLGTSIVAASLQVQLAEAHRQVANLPPQSYYLPLNQAEKSTPGATLVLMAKRGGERSVSSIPLPSCSGRAGFTGRRRPGEKEARTKTTSAPLRRNLATGQARPCATPPLRRAVVADPVMHMPCHDELLSPRQRDWFLSGGF